MSVHSCPSASKASQPRLWTVRGQEKRHCVPCSATIRNAPGRPANVRMGKVSGSAIPLVSSLMSAPAVRGEVHA